MAIRYALFVVLEKILRWAVSPRLRAQLMRMLGARIGRNVRIYEIQLFNIGKGFKNLNIGDDVHIGVGCRLDLEGQLNIGPGSTLSPGVTILTHQDPGSAHKARLVELYPPKVSPTTIGGGCWLGTNVIVLAGACIGDCVVVAAGSVVSTHIPDHVLAAGSPATVKKTLSLD